MKNIFFILFVFLSTGIVLNHYINISISIALPFIFLLAGFIFSRKVGFFLFATGVFLFGMHIIYKNIKPITQPYVFVDCVITSIPEKLKHYEKATCFVLDSDIDNLKFKKINVYYKKNQKVYLLSEISAFGKIKLHDKKINMFLLDNFLLKKESPLYFLFALRDFLIENYKENSLNEKSFAIGKAIIFGERDNISYKTYKTFIETGLIHLLAISGLHVGLLIAFFIFSIKRRDLRYKIILTSLPFYAVFTGLHIPVIRASFMAFLYFLGKYLELRVNPINILFFVAFIVLLVSPESLFSISFQLSFLAAVGIILSIKFISISAFKYKFLNIGLSSVLLSFIATIFTLPVILYNFGAFSPISIISTSLALIPMYIFVGLSIPNILTGFSIEPIVKLMDLFGLAFLKVVRFFYIDEGYLRGFSPDLSLVIVYIIVLVFILLVSMNIFYKLTALIISATIFLFLSKDFSKSYKIYVFQGKRKPYMVISKQNEFSIIISDFLNQNIKKALNKSNPYKIYVYSKRLDNFYTIDFIPLYEKNCVENICFYKNKNIYNVKINNTRLLIENKNTIYEVEKK